jgi:hypothetical protein
METKLQLIETPDYTLAVSNEEIKEGDYHLAERIVKQVGSKAIAFTDKEQLLAISEIGGAKKIIAYLPKGNAPELDLPLLPEIVVEDDVEKASNSHFKDYWKREDGTEMKGAEISAQQMTNYLCEVGAFIAGYKAATKVYSEDEAIGFYLWARKKYGSVKPVEEGCIVEKTDYKGLFHIYIQSLKQPKTPKWFVAEMENKVALDGHTIIGMEFKTHKINGKPTLRGYYL